MVVAGIESSFTPAGPLTLGNIDDLSESVGKIALQT